MNKQEEAARKIYFELKINYHPDEPFENYIGLNKKDSLKFKKLIKQLYKGNEDVYEVCMKVFREYNHKNLKGE